jgi:hypothetical protein
MATSHQSTWRSTSSTCADHGIPSSQWSTYSSKYRTLLTIRRQDASPSVSRSRSTLDMQNFAAGLFMSACRRWNEKTAATKTWTHFKSQFAAAHRQHKQMKGETAAHAGFHLANAAMTKTEDHMAEATIGALENLATATAADRGVVAALTQANARLVKQLEETSSELTELKALLHQERRAGVMATKWARHKPHLQHSQPWSQSGSHSG